jgi:hypothetical protein
MDPLSAVMARCSFVWLLAGFIAGALMLTDESVPGNWRLWLQPTHAHVLFVGWFLLFALGIAYWLLPRKRTPDRPLGYDVSIAYLAVIALNLGLALRVIAEPADRSGHGGSWTEPVFAVSALLQVGAAVIFVTQLWPRVTPRAARTATGRGTPAPAAQEPTQAKPRDQGGIHVEHQDRSDSTE